MGLNQLFYLVTGKFFVVQAWYLSALHNSVMAKWLVANRHGGEKIAN